MTTVNKLIAALIDERARFTALRRQSPAPFTITEEDRLQALAYVERTAVMGLRESDAEASIVNGLGTRFQRRRE